MTGGTASLVRTGSGVTSYRAEGAGPPLVLLHGLQVGQELFNQLRLHLESAFTVITYDQRDRGNTRFEPSAYTTDDLADDLALLLEALGLSRAHVLGASFGGMVAQAFALRHADLVDGLVLGATSQAPFRPERVAAPVAELLRALENGNEEHARALLARMAPAATSTSADSRAPRSPDRNEGLIRRFAAARSFDTRGHLGDITAETLVVHGRHDAVVPVVDALSMAGEVPRADVLVLAGCGHTWENERPARAAAAITCFLADAR